MQIGVNSKGSKAADVKKENDTKIDGIVKYIKKMGVDAKDFQTTRVYLNDEYDYDKKKHNYVATQTINILIKDLSKYDEMMEGLTDIGVNNISGIEFKSSKEESLKANARKLAVINAKEKAEELVAAVGQKIGRAFTITDNSPVDYPQPRFAVAMMKMADGVANDTLATGEIEITANVSVSFVLE
ncbi:SIMPL domain-containing protein [Flavobacterium sp. 3HN19-14]|uniref:SIMPL domain-containing protein n=1 Tax=Flavobacterium sp. 3HN19-14 TaxID=3448133 RepID=UPI003EE15E7C